MLTISTLLMSDFVNQFVANVSLTFANRAGWYLVDFVPLDPGHNFFWGLHQALQGVS